MGTTTNTMCNSNGIQVEPAHIGRLGLPQQLTAKLIRAGILTIEDLERTTECELLHLRGVGRKSITQIKRAFEPLGLRLAPRPQPVALATDIVSPVGIEHLGVVRLLAGAWRDDQVERSALARSLVAMRRSNNVRPTPGLIRAIERCLPLVEEAVLRNWNECAATSLHNGLARRKRDTVGAAEDDTFFGRSSLLVSQMMTAVDLLSRCLAVNGFMIDGALLSADDAATCVDAWTILFLAVMARAEELETGVRDALGMVGTLLFPGTGSMFGDLTVQVGYSTYSPYPHADPATEAERARGTADSLLAEKMLSAEEHRLLLASSSPAEPDDVSRMSGLQSDDDIRNMDLSLTHILLLF
jgi:hypothetical protein